ncbi:MAG: T9SS type A sorting domain-containing protein [Saprospiraceae bacterium]|nr:T9SS type A sorting domain-containing protein [Saprospiraceae bacterium]
MKLVAWPNPAGDRVNISFESSVEDEVRFRFINTMGQVVLISKMECPEGLNTHVIDVSQVHQGSYQMQMKTALDMQSKVILILRNE